ncbi:LPS export ABC transporter permease LptF [Acidocella aromatica]|uniref:Lipopolysaccharide export system permease protein LptF n=1 Tax=Acidocella aromatica TaxID=1303579 RepID=A0A840VED6_9PROT|nr:LPS export ABC transporter permease LptF [Acidocella aromatica]MBB5374223.1 lipopolysaccharide export system permease protein [Acidocella aromatica]
MAWQGTGKTGNEWFNALILNRYLTREISRPFAVILGILCVLFTGYSVASILSDAVSGLLPTLTIAELTGLKLLIALDVLIPISLYFAVLLSFGRLYGDSEFTAMWALGVQPTQIARIVLSLAGIVALAVAALSLEVRPWAYQTSHSVTWHGATSLDVNAMQAGTFYTSEDGQRVIFLTHRAGPGAPAQDVFVRRQLAGHTEVIFAKLASSLQQRAASGQHEVYLTNAHVYEIYPPESAQNDQILNAQGLIIDPESAPGAAPAYNPITADSLDLMRSSSPRDIAELEWRLSTPISTLLLALLAVPLSYSRVRQGKYAKFGQAILIYAGYYLLCTTARTWVEHEMIGTLPGIWWAPALLALVLTLILATPHWRNRRAAKARAAAAKAGANAS